jgi:NADH:ubiquinone reductase (non-electrogenic)
VFFLKQLSEARAIRNRLIEAFERAGMPSLPASEKQRLLTFVVVGGGPTNIEFASELHDFLRYIYTYIYILIYGFKCLFSYIKYNI